MPFARAPYNSSRVVLLPCIAARLGTSDRLHLTQRGLAPRKKSQTYAGARRGRSASYPTAPSRIPACSFPAPGSSELFASALVQWYWLSPLLPAVRLASRSPVIRTGGCFLCGLHSSVVRFPRPLAAGITRRSGSPPFIGSPSLGWRYLPALRPETMGPPSFLTLLLFRATLLDPGRPSAASPFTAALCGLPASLTGSPPAFIFVNENLSKKPVIVG
jgi:hypothetical protein